MAERTKTVTISREWFDELIRDSVLVDNYFMRELERVRTIWDGIDVKPETKPDKSRKKSVKLNYKR